jgi:hypothetical protein
VTEADPKTGRAGRCQESHPLPQLWDGK